MSKPSSPVGLLRLLSFINILYLLFFVGLPSSFAEHTRRWRQSTYDEFLKGTAHGVAVRSDGRLELAPKLTLLADAEASYLWALRVDAKGTLYAAGGTPAKVFRFDVAGKPTTVFDSTELSAQAIAFDSNGALYVGTSPDGKVYRVSASGEKSVFFDPKTKYIWDLAFASDGSLYVATGDKGQIFRVAPDGKSELFYSSEEAHMKVLAFDARHNLIAGTEPSGRILRITNSSQNSQQNKQKPSAEGFVIYESNKREVTSLAVGNDGSIYASAIGEKSRAAASAPSTVIVNPQGTTTFTATGGGVSGQAQSPAPFIAFPPLLSSSIYRIPTDGAAEELWSSRETVVYSLGIASDGRLLAGTGNNGELLAIDGRGVFAQLAKAGSAQITAITRGANERIFLCTANPGKVLSVGPEYEPEGTYESRSFDAQLFSQWGRLEWWSPPPAGPAHSSFTTKANASEKSASSAKNVPTTKPANSSTAPRTEFFVRSGNTEDPGKEWSRWYGPYSRNSSPVEAPPARFVQWKAVIHDGRPGDGIDWVSLAYLPRNVAPVIDGIALQDPGVRAQAPTIITGSQPQNVALKQPPAPSNNAVFITQSSTSPRFEAPPQGTKEKGYQSVLWNAHDDNDDELRYAVYFRGENEHEWKLLKDKLEQKFYSWDTTALPDGAYYLKVIASDAPSNPPSNALITERESERFEVDNTPPVIEKLEATAIPSAKGRAALEKTNGSVPFPADNAGQLHSTGIIVKFTARDASTSIDRAQYSVDGGEWILVAPKSSISDALSEEYEFTAGSAEPGEHTVAVRAYDRFENVGSAKTTMVLPAIKH